MEFYDDGQQIICRREIWREKTNNKKTKTKKLGGQTMDAKVKI